MYGKDFVLRSPLEQVRCWNCTDGSTGSFAVGETITVVCIYDAHSTTILCKEADGRPLTNKDGTPQRTEGYRFIVPNAMLNSAIDADVPLTTPDLIGDIIAYEEGTASPEQEQALFETLRESGLGYKLQGHYGRSM
jgi:hypothetical protein